MNKVKPNEINIYDEYGISDNDSDYDELNIINENIRNPSDIISKDNNNYETESDSSDDNIYYQIKENASKDPKFIKKSINKLSQRLKILPDPIKKTFINVEKPLPKSKFCYSFRKMLFCI